MSAAGLRISARIASTSRHLGVDLASIWCWSGADGVSMWGGCGLDPGWFLGWIWGHGARTREALRMYRLLRPEAAPFYEEDAMRTMQAKANKVSIEEAPASASEALKAPARVFGASRGQLCMLRYDAQFAFRQEVCSESRKHACPNRSSSGRTRPHLGESGSMLMGGRVAELCRIQATRAQM